MKIGESSAHNAVSTDSTQRPLSAAQMWEQFRALPRRRQLRLALAVLKAVVSALWGIFLRLPRQEKRILIRMALLTAPSYLRRRYSPVTPLLYHLLALFFLLGPIAYGVGGVKSFIWATVYTVTFVALFRLIDPLRASVVKGLVLGAVMTFVTYPATSVLQSTYGQLRTEHVGVVVYEMAYYWFLYIGVGTGLGMGSGLLTGSRTSSFRPRQLKSYIVITGLMMFIGLVLTLPVAILGDLSSADPLMEFSATSSVVLGAVAGVQLGSPIGQLFGELAGVRLRPVVVTYSAIWPYFRAMLTPSIGFLLVYIVTVGWFAGLYSTLYRVDHTSFGGLTGNPSIWDFLFFSITTIGSVGYSEMRPLGVWARVGTSLELLVGMGLTVVLFAAVIAYVTPRFELVAKGLPWASAFSTKGSRESQTSAENVGVEENKEPGEPSPPEPNG